MSRSSAEDQLKFVMTCLKHIPDKQKPNFDEVARELGLSANTCYQRHWRLMKDWGVSNSRAAGAGSLSTSDAPSTPSAAIKRGRTKGELNKKPAKVVDIEESANVDEVDDDEEATPSKKVKAEEPSVIIKLLDDEEV